MKDVILLDASKFFFFFFWLYKPPLCLTSAAELNTTVQKMWQEHVLACGQQPGDVLDTVVKQSIICHWGLNPLPSQLSDDSQPVVLSSMARQIGTPSRISNVPYFSAFNADQMTSFIDRQVAKRHDYWPGDFASLTPVELRAEVMVSEQLELRRDAAFAFVCCPSHLLKTHIY